MPSQELLDYVKSNLAAGFTPDAIKAELLTAGWAKDDIDQALGLPPTSEPGSAVSATPRKFLSKKTAIIAGVIVIVLLLAAGAAAYFLIPPTPEKVLEASRKQSASIKSFDYSGNIVADFTAPSGMFSLDTLFHGPLAKSSNKNIAGTSMNKFGMEFSGSADVSDDANPKVDLSMNFNYSLVTFGLQFRLLDKLIYIKVKQLPDLGEVDLKKYADTWIKLDPEAISKQLGVGIDLTEKKPDLTDGQKKQIEDLTKNAHLYNKITALKDDSIDNKAMYHYAIDIDKPGLITYYNQVYRIENAGGNLGTNPSTVFKNINFSNWEIWVGKSDKMVYRVSGEISAANPTGSMAEFSGSATILLNLKNFNHAGAITAPTEYKNFQDVYDELNKSSEAKYRDEQRVMDIRDMVTVLEYYYQDNNNKYPKTLAGLINSDYDDYLYEIPTAPTPPDGGCTAVNNAYTYAQTKSGKDYTLTFCLGAETENYAAGLHTASSTGIK